MTASEGADEAAGARSGEPESASQGPGHAPAGPPHGERQGPGGRNEGDPTNAEPGSSPATPSWLHVIGTTVRLWVRRHLRTTTPLSTSSAEWVRTGQRVRPGGRRPFGVSVLAIAIITASVLIVTVRGTTTEPAPSGAGAAQGQGTGALHSIGDIRGETAAWVAGQVAASAIVACDPVMCTALQTHGLAAQNLVTLQPAASDPLGSDVVVATAAVRNQFGSRLASVYAPVVIASFGSGPGRIDVRAIAPDGSAAYEAALVSDRQERQIAGGQLLRNSKITTGLAAARELAKGQVDSRLLIVLAALAAKYRLNIVAFGALPPGAGPDVPLRSVDVKGNGQQGAAELRQVLAFLQAQLPPYRPLRTQLVRPGGQAALHIEFSAPSPLGLLGPHV